MPADFSRLVDQRVLQADKLIAEAGTTSTIAVHQVTVPTGKRYTVLFYECTRVNEGDITVSFVDTSGKEIVVDRGYSVTELRGPLHIPFSYPEGTIIRVSYGSGTSGLMITRAIINTSDMAV